MDMVLVTDHIHVRNDEQPVVKTKNEAKLFTRMEIQFRICMV